MSYSQVDVATESDNHSPLTQTSTPLSLPTNSTITSFQIINPELTPSHHPKTKGNTHSPYHINYNSLLHYKIDPLHRYKLMKWLQSEVVRQKYYREVFALTSYYLDAYLSKSDSIQLKDLQIIALAALLIATKTDGATFPKLGQEFDINEILEMEIKICLKLNYFLNPKTYAHRLNQYIHYWEKFNDQSKLYQKEDQYLNQSLTSFHRHRSLYEKAEWINMNPQSHKFDHEKLVFNLFYLENKINMIKISIKDLTHENLTTFINDSYEKLDKYGFIFQEFIQFCSEDFQYIGLYLSSFINIPISPEIPKCKCLNYQSYLKMQTVTEQAVRGMDKLVKKMI